MRFRSWALLGCLLIPAGPAFAAETVELAPVVVRAARPRFPAQPQGVVILDRERLRASGASTLAQLLKHEASFSIREYGPRGQLATATMRGSLGEGILVLRDGVKLNSPTLGGKDLSTVSLLGVDRVEILSGGASGLYGSEAVGGVINLVSQEAPINRLEAGLGNWGERYVQAETGAGWEDGSVRAGLRRLLADNAYPYEYRKVVSDRANAQFDGLDLSVGARQRWGYDALALDLTYLQHDKGIPGPVNYPSPRASQHDRDLSGTLRWSRDWEDGPRQRTALSHRVNALQALDPLAIAGISSLTRVDTTDLQTQLSWEGAANALTWGLGGTLDTVDGPNFGLKARTSLTTFVHDTWYASDRLTVQGDLRLDHQSTFGLHASPRLGLSYTLAPELRLRTALGQAYRAPTFNDLYWPESAQSAGNPALRPEVTRTFELGADAQLGKRLSLMATAFLNQGTDTISWQPDAASRWTPRNLGQTETSGLEARALFRPWEILTLEGSGTWLSARDMAPSGATAGKALLYRPALVAHAGVTLHPITPLTLSAGWDYTGLRYTTAANTEFLEPFALFSARLAYAVTEKDTLSIRGENLANNTQYVLQPYYPMPGTTLVASWAHVF